MRRVKRCIMVFLIFYFLMSSIAYANIILKLVAANPSKGQTQKVMLKAYLPKEAKPEDVIDKEDLDIAYDTQQGCYFVSHEYEIKPGQFIEKDVELKDIWTIPQTDIESLRQEMAKMKDLLKNTDYGERIEFLKTSIDNKLNQIVESQANVPTNPERHIFNYRDNLKMMDLVKQDMTLARSLLTQGTGLPAATTWKLLFAIIAFLGLLGVSFYIIWNKQLKSIINDTLIGEETKKAQAEIRAESHKAEEEKPPGSGDIEDIIRNKP